MTQEEKQLLLKDLSARLPYEVQCHIKYINHLIDWIDEGDVILTGFRQDEFTKETEPLFCNPDGNPKIVFPIDSIKPYLRPLSSMTDEEGKELEGIFSEIDAPCWVDTTYGCVTFASDNDFIDAEIAEVYTDWLNKKMFDYRGLIEKGLALEAPEDMYKTE